MAGLTLITGPAGSGKTQRLVDVAASRYASDPFSAVLVLAPTVRHADQFRQRLVHGGRVAFGLEVMTLALYSRQQARAAGVTLPSSDVTDELLRRVTLTRIEDGGAGRFLPIAATPGLHTLVSRAVADLVAEGIDAERFSEAAMASGEPDLAALADIYTAYRAELARRGWREPREAGAVAADAVRADRVPTLILVDGVQFLRPGEADLVAALARHADVHLALDPTASARAAWTEDALASRVPDTERVALPPRPSAVEIGAASAADAEAQLREIARSIKQQLTSDASLRPSDVAVAFRQVTPHLTLARRVFREFDLLLDPAAGEQLALRPFGVWLLRLLRLGSRGWRVQHLADVIRAGFLDRRRWHVEGDTAEHLVQVARKRRLWSGRESLDSLVDALAIEAGEATSPAYAARLRVTQEALRAMLRDLDAWLAAPPASPSAHATRLDDALFGVDGIVRNSVDGYDGLEVDVRGARRELTAFRAVAEQLGESESPFEAFVEAFAAQLSRPATLLREAGGVLLAPAHTLHGLRFRHVYVGGLAEGEFPATRSSPPLLDRRRREALAASGLSLPPEARASEDELWEALRTRAEESLSLWRPRLNAAGRPVAASYYFAQHDADARDVERAVAPEGAASRPELAIALARRWRDGERRRPRDLSAWHVVRVAAPVEQQRRSFDSAGRFEGLPGAAALPDIIGPEDAWSASRIESYQTCPFQFFAHYALRLDEVEEERESADPAIRGTVIHEILDEAIQPLVDQELPLDESTVEGVVARMREVAPATWDTAPTRLAFGRAGLWRYERAETLDRLEALLRQEARQWSELPVTRVAAPEARVTVDVPDVEPPLRLYAIIDRLDVGEGVARVVDYKSGREIRESDVRAGRRVQLQWYALAAQLQTGADRVVARYVYVRPGARSWKLDTAKPEDAAAVRDAIALVQAIRERVSEGTFPVLPQSDPCPTYCAYRHACRVNQFSRRKDWPHA